MAGSYQPAPPCLGYASRTWCCIYGTHGTCNGISLMGYGLLYSFAFELCASRFVPSQWETALLCNDVFHWLGVSLESALNCQSVSENMKGHRSTAFLMADHCSSQIPSGCCNLSHFTNMDSRHGYVMIFIVKWVMKLIVHAHTSAVQPVKFGNG